MPSDDLISRMQALNGKPLKNLPEAEAPKQRKVRVQKKSVTKVKVDAPDVNLDDIFGGKAAEAKHGPGFLLIEKPANDLEAEATLICRRFTQLTGYPDGSAVDRIATVCDAKHISPEDVLFLDIETTGLGMTPVFLIGTMECTQDGFMFKQYFARNFSEESSIISAVSDRLKNVQMLVTFNGKTFDMPFIANRATAAGVHLHQAKSHLDLLHESRKIYRGSVPNCKLQTLERHICGRYREDDIPSAEIPAAYNAYVRTGKTKKIGRIIEHNLFDILTMADLMTRMWRRE